MVVRGKHTTTAAGRTWKQGITHAETEAVNPRSQRVTAGSGVKRRTPHGKGNAPLEATGHSEPSPGKREVQTTEVRTE